MIGWILMLIAGCVVGISYERRDWLILIIGVAIAIIGIVIP